MKKVYFDTNVVLRFLLGDIGSQVLETKRMLEKARSGLVKIVIPEFVIFEIWYTLYKYYKLGKEEIITKIEIILSVNFFEIEKKEIFMKTLIYYGISKLSLADCFLVAKSEIEEGEIFTFDEDLKKFARKAAS